MDMNVEPRTVLRSASVLVLDRDYRALTLWSNTHRGFTLPGGKTEPEDPSPEHTAIRELMEETRLLVEVGDLRPLHKGILRGGPTLPDREMHLFYARRVSGQAGDTARDRPLRWSDYDRLILDAPAFYSDFYRLVLPPATGFVWLQPTEGA